jgi:hypothetical protein
MTPQEAAKLAIGSSSNLDPDKVEEYLLTASPRDIQTFLHCTGVNGDPRLIEFARVALEIRLAEDAAKSAAEMERQTDKIVRLTWGLFWLTLALAFVAAVQLYIMLK